MWLVFILVKDISCVMVSVLASSVVEGGFKIMGEIKDYTIAGNICCFSAKHASLRSKN